MKGNKVHKINERGKQDHEAKIANSERRRSFESYPLCPLWTLTTSDHIV